MDPKPVCFLVVAAAFPAAVRDEHDLPRSESAAAVEGRVECLSAELHRLHPLRHGRRMGVLTRTGRIPRISRRAICTTRR